MNRTTPLVITSHYRAVVPVACQNYNWLSFHEIHWSGQSGQFFLTLFIKSQSAIRKRCQGSVSRVKQKQQYREWDSAHNHVIMFWIFSVRRMADQMSFSTLNSRKYIHILQLGTTILRVTSNLQMLQMWWTLRLNLDTHPTSNQEEGKVQREKFLRNGENSGCSICMIVDYWEATWLFSRSG